MVMNGVKKLKKKPSNACIKGKQIVNMTENFQSKSARTIYIYINMSTA